MAIKVIKFLKNKNNSFQAHTAFFVCSPFLVEKGRESIKEIYNYNIVRDRFEIDLVNVMKNRPLVAKKQRKRQYTLASLSLSENRENCH